ncbi:MAG TPA: ABC transporter ATP-binding protein [Chloroflexota bacterium]|jgi:putative ABC transport system ATP-binding protein
MSDTQRISAVLETVGVERVYGAGEAAVHALRGVSLAVAPGERVAITGPSGCGKTTLLHLLGGLDHPTNGEVRFAGAPFARGRAAAAVQRRHLGFIFQSFGLLPALTARENVELPLALAGVEAGRRALAARTMLELVELSDRADYLVEELSGGQRQRVAVARALAGEPTVVLADEPTGSLDSATAVTVIELLLRLLAERGAALVLVTHDAEMARRADREVRLRDGLLEGARA